MYICKIHVMCKHVQVQEYKDQTCPLIVTVSKKIKKPQF